MEPLPFSLFRRECERRKGRNLNKKPTWEGYYSGDIEGKFWFAVQSSYEMGSTVEPY
jgi:hypothetical protein